METSSAGNDKPPPTVDGRRESEGDVVFYVDEPKAGKNTRFITVLICVVSNNNHTSNVTIIGCRNS